MEFVEETENLVFERVEDPLKLKGHAQVSKTIMSFYEEWSALMNVKVV